MRRRGRLIVVAVATAAGLVTAWFARQLLHLHDPGLSDHRR